MWALNTVEDHKWFMVQIVPPYWRPKVENFQSENNQVHSLRQQETFIDCGGLETVYIVS